MYSGLFLIFIGLMFVSNSLDKIAKNIDAANAMKKAELAAAGILCPEDAAEIEAETSVPGCTP